MSRDSVVVASGATSGLSVSLHPLAILNISDHYSRAQLTSDGGVPKLVGALLGSQTDRDVSIVNSFELVYGLNAEGGIVLDEEFFKDRREQFAQVFPTQSVLGWYNITADGTPTRADVGIHAQVIESDAGPGLFVVFDPAIPAGAKALPFAVYESALEAALEGEAKAADAGAAGGMFIQLECGIETGEAERIAVEGVTKEVGADGDETGQISSLTMQRNAIAMMYDRVVILVKYIQAVIDGTAKPDHDIIRQIGALVATLPVMDATEFKAELQNEQNDVQLTGYLTTLLNQMEAWSSYTDMHFALHPPTSEEGPTRTPGKAFNRPQNMPGRRQRRGF